MRKNRESAMSRGASRRQVVEAGVVVSIGLVPAGTVRAADKKAKTPKYYFRISEVSGEVDDQTKKLAADLCARELKSRPEFTSDLGGAVSASSAPAKLAPELKKRGLRGFDISLKFEEFKSELKDPRPGGRLKQLAISVHLSLFGAEIPGKKIAFSGHGESMQIAEVFEKKLEEEKRTLVEEIIGDALRQAVDQAVLKLALPRNEPINENKRKRPRRRRKDKDK